MFDSPSDLLKHNERISSLPHKDSKTNDHVSQAEMFGFANYHLARAAACMLLDHGVEHELFMHAMSDELEARGELDEAE